MFTQDFLLQRFHPNLQPHFPSFVPFLLALVLSTSAREYHAYLLPACQISSGARPPRDQISPDTDSSSDVEEIGEGTNQLKRIDSGQAITELQQIFEDVITCIDCLYRLSMTIRNGVAAHDRLVKAGTIDTTFYEEWDIQHVKEKFPTTQASFTRLPGD